MQLPLSGTVLALPEALRWIARPLVALYWGTSAYLQSMQGTRFYEALQVISPLTVCPGFVCLLILGLQTVLGLMIALSGCKITRLGITRKHSGT